MSLVVIIIYVDARKSAIACKVFFLAIGNVANCCIQACISGYIHLLLKPPPLCSNIRCHSTCLVGYAHGRLFSS